MRTSVKTHLCQRAVFDKLLELRFFEAVPFVVAAVVRHVARATPQGHPAMHPCMERIDNVFPIPGSKIEKNAMT